MASENETVAKVIDDFAYLITLGNIGPNVATDIKNRIESAWRREKARVMQAATEVAMAPTQVKYEPRPKRNCDRFASFKEALDAHKNECCESTEIYGQKMFSLKSGCLMFVDWLFAPVAEGGES